MDRYDPNNSSPHVVTVTVSGGVVQDIAGIPVGVIVRVEDWDGLEMKPDVADYSETFNRPAPAYVARRILAEFDSCVANDDVDGAFRILGDASFLRSLNARLHFAWMHDDINAVREELTKLLEQDCAS